MTDKKLTHGPICRDEDVGIPYWFHVTPKEWDHTYLVPMADSHYGLENQFDNRKFRGYCQWIADTPEALVLWNGDLINVGLPGTVDEDWWDQRPLTPQEQLNELVDIVKEYDLKDKTLAVVGGSNHPARARKVIGHDYDWDFAHELGLEHKYGRYGVAVKLTVGKIPYLIYATHGWAGGRLLGASINAARELGALMLCDVYITAHRHQDTATRDEFIEFDTQRPRIQVRRRLYVSSGTFMGWGGYAQAKGMRPTGTGTPRIRFDGKERDVHASI